MRSQHSGVVYSRRRHHQLRVRVDRQVVLLLRRHAVNVPCRQIARRLALGDESQPLGHDACQDLLHLAQRALNASHFLHPVLRQRTQPGRVAGDGLNRPEGDESEVNDGLEVLRVAVEFGAGEDAARDEGDSARENIAESNLSPVWSGSGDVGQRTESLSSSAYTALYLPVSARLTYHRIRQGCC